MDKTKNILGLEAEKAKEFFLKGSNYCNITLPPYFSFDSVLKEIDEKIQDKNISDFYNTGDKPNNYENVNYKLFNNKDGQYAWRLFQLIHPVLYVALVNKITEKENWTIIQKRFKKFQAIENIKCTSIPVVKDKKQTQTQILTWWQETEQKSIKLSLDYKYIFITDITDCYGAIYTHSIPWALHGKTDAKDHRNDKNVIGNYIDCILQSMQHGQTNGIPQGSILMDFIAEMVLGYADLELSKKIEDEIKDEDFQILRYRDDYRIFVNDVSLGKKILKTLTGVLSDLNMRLNVDKTKHSSDIIESSIKPDKLFLLSQNTPSENLQKRLLFIKEVATKYPNSGSLIRLLDDFSDQIRKRKNYQDTEVMLSIVVDIMYHNPRIYPQCAIIISEIIDDKSFTLNKFETINKIRKKFEDLPNTEFLEIWLQRLSIKFNDKIKFKSKFCQKINDKKVNVFNSEWLKMKDIKIEDIVNKDKLSNLPAVISKDEVFRYSEYGGSINIADYFAPIQNK